MGYSLKVKPTGFTDDYIYPKNKRRGKNNSKVSDLRKLKNGILTNRYRQDKVEGFEVGKL